MLDVGNTSRDVERSGVDTAVLPVGAIEQHGPHLPLSVDWVVADAVARGVAESLNALLLPALAFGNSQAHTGFRGSISLSAETLGSVVHDIGRSLLAQGFRRIVVVNTHAGNLILKPTVRHLNMTQDQGKVVLVRPRMEALGEVLGIVEGGPGDVHAGEYETSLMMHLAPEQVGDERVDHVPDVGEDYFDYTPMKEFCPEGVWGRSSLATAEKGKKLLPVLIEQTAASVERTFERLGVKTRRAVVSGDS